MNAFLAEYEPVADFYAGKSVFITGVTGFLGKVLLEKLLYVCKDIDTVYVLIRDKRGVSVRQRIQQLLNTPLFSRLRAEREHDIKKVVAIIGDINQPNLGISLEDEIKIQEKVSVVFHVAATIKFHETLDVAYKTNVEGTRYVLNLCKRIKNNKVFVHFSTAYSNTNQEILHERLYPPPAEFVEVEKVLEQECPDQALIEQLLKSYPNTYTFTKAMAETLVAQNHGDIPTIIIRPSIVCAASKEPVPGWVDNLYGATGITIACVRGLNRVMLAKDTNILDVIPVDYVSNLTIVAAARCKSTKTVTVYNSCSSSCNPITLTRYFNMVKDLAIKAGFYDIYPTLTFTNCKLLVWAMTFFLQLLPAYLADLYRRIRGYPPKFVKLQAKVIFGRNVLAFFTSNSWEMKADQVKNLYNNLSLEDKQTFPFDPSHINWDEYAHCLFNGMKKLMNGDFS